MHPLEVWTPVRTHPNYDISNHGRVRIRRSQHVLLLTQRSNKYLQVTLHKNSVVKSATLHRLVAEHFLHKPAGATQVDHINKDITNNASWNLRWVTASENMRYARTVAAHESISPRVSGHV